VLSVDPVGYSMTVESGCILQTLQETAAAHDRFFPAQPRRAGLVPDRRQSLDQRRRRAGAALRQRAQPGDRASRSCCPTATSGTACARSRRTTPATTSSTCSWAPRARSASSPRRC
jgi:hypothetical protein